MAASRLASTSSGGFVAAGEPPAMAAPGAPTGCDAFSEMVAVLLKHLRELELCHPGSGQQIQEGCMPRLGHCGDGSAEWQPPGTVDLAWHKHLQFPDRQLLGWTAAEAACGCRLLLETGAGRRGATAGPSEAASGAADEPQQRGNPLSCGRPR